MQNHIPRTTQLDSTRSKQESFPGQKGHQENPPAYGLIFADQELPTIQPMTDSEQKSVIGTSFNSRINNTGLPDRLKTGVENLSGHSMDDVKVHYNSSKPAKVNALAYAQGTNIHLAPGQKKHLPHEAWHVVQQKQGRVKPTMKIKSDIHVNDDYNLEKEADEMGLKSLQGKDLVKPLVQAKHSSQIGGIYNPYQLRTENPHKWGDNVTSHHIISDHVLDQAIGKKEIEKEKRLGSGSGLDATRIMAKFLPDFDRLDLEKLMRVGAALVEIKLNQLDEWEEVDLEPNKPNPLFSNKYNDYMENFGTFDRNQMDTIRIKLTGVYYDMKDFKRRYNRYRDNPKDEEGFDLSNLAASYYEWQGGNLFYGPDRAETMKSNQFDNDGSDFYSPEHINALKKIDGDLRQEMAKPAPDPEVIEDTLNQLALRTRNLEPPDFNAEHYVRIKNQTHLNLLKNLVNPLRQPKLAVGKSVPSAEANIPIDYKNLFTAWQKFVDGKFKNYRAHNYKNSQHTFSFMGITAKVDVDIQNHALNFLIEGEIYKMPVGEKPMKDKKKGISKVFKQVLDEWRTG